MVEAARSRHAARRLWSEPRSHMAATRPACKQARRDLFDGGVIP